MMEEKNFVSTTSFSKFTNNLIPFELYSELIKGKQTTLLLFTSILAYLISAKLNVRFDHLILLAIGMFYAISGSTLFNMYFDRDIDKKMPRTKDRALPTGKISPKIVIWHGFIFSVFGMALLGFVFNLLTMFIVFLGVFFDVVIYTLILKRRTKYSIIFGGIAGGLPAVAGRIAVINQIDIVSIIFLFFILSWIPIHILTLAMIPKNKEGYKLAGVPMWPVVESERQTLCVISVSAMITGLSVLFAGYLLNIHLFTALLLLFSSCGLMLISIKNLVKPSIGLTWKIFKFASIFMSVSFVILYIGVLLNL